MKTAQIHSFLVKLLPFVIAMTLVIGFLLPTGTVKADSNIFPLPLPMSDNQAHITDGIIIWGCMIVAIIFIGVIIGSQRTGKKQPGKPKRE